MTATQTAALKPGPVKDMWAEDKFSARILKIALCSTPVVLGRHELLIRKTCFLDFPLRGGDVVGHSMQFNQCFAQVVRHISCVGIIIARLPHGTPVYKVLFAALDPKLCVGPSTNHAVANKSDGHVRVPEEAKIGLLAHKARSRSQFVEHVFPSRRNIQGCVDDGEILDSQDVGKAVQPLAVVRGKLFPRPIQYLRGVGVKSVERKIRSAVFVVVPFNAWSFHCTHDVDARFRVGATAYEIPKECMMSASLLPGMLQDSLERFEIRVDVGYNRKLHRIVQ